MVSEAPWPGGDSPGARCNLQGRRLLPPRTTVFLAPHHLLVALAILAFAPPLRCPQPDFGRSSTAADPAALPFPLPVFRVPLEDDDCPILAVFVGLEGPTKAELHVVTADEDHPISVVDHLYDAQRWFGLVEPSPRFPFIRRARGRSGYRRIADVETVILDLAPSPTAPPTAIRFPGTYSAEQRWDVLLARHHSAEIPWDRFDLEDGRPVLYVNTWNHLFSNDPSNGCDDHRLVGDYPVYLGSRADVQRHFEAVWTNFGLDL